MAEAAALVSGAARAGRNEPSREQLGGLRRKKVAGMTRREARWWMLIRSQETNMEISVDFPILFYILEKAV
jgi:hypothetical protein